MNDLKYYEKELAPSLMDRIILAAELYYIFHLTQNEIAERLGVSRPWVSKLLRKAEDLGIVRIEVTTYTLGVPEIEQKLIQKYKLKNAKVIKTTPDGPGLIQCARAACHYFISILKPTDSIGIAWGNSLATMVDQLIPLSFPEVNVLPLVGGVGKDPALLSNQLAVNLAKSLGAKCSILHVPAIVSGKEEKEIFLNNPMVHTIIEKSQNVDIALFGIGDLRHSTICREGYIGSNEIDELESMGAVGDIALHFIDQEGHLVHHPIIDHIISSNITKTRESARITIGFALGLEKVPAIRAALMGQWLDVMITDLETANMLLKY